ncbi:MAG: type II toxin-antitoxin system RelE/ParE family toxin [Gemmatimonadetes bacterium]|nr:type II toxin-antitoxin system RelE/ParE family toxin [Gemmatimonadota bacterium]MBK6779934.1 type II toxin-antitoxin system RelE/ParE family toxin [Gemmatimonadota bacterium]MBK7717549.1 type II toxin-antitoxin system RelE/ParE family toxin [Gemmatimonadota bacterium]MBK7786926.1 type II toxin-antitoxin system RelE/ParE family toxin [Gemmatimonadota bacterium]MBK7922195.1 type II toxin-antitoxin system RelE/ParE family toxin [Gemmatimonadota bacterium]
MELIETPVFSRQVDAAVSDEAYLALQWHLLLAPDSGALIPGSGGLRKLRWALPGRGKRGGARVIYYWQKPAHRIFLVFMYPKNERSDLTPAQLKALRKLVEAD